MKKKTLSIIEKVVFSVVAISIVCVCFASLIQMPNAPIKGDVVGNITNKTQSDYTLILVMGIPAFIALFLPFFLRKKFNIEVPTTIKIIYDIFFFCAVVLGEYFSFYYIFDGWDSILHFTSAILITYIAYSIIVAVIGEEKVKAHPWMIIFFSIAIAEFAGTMWELCEFTMDSFGLNSQKFQDGNGVDLVGRAALMDTMCDVIVNSLGTVTANIFGYYSLKHEKVFFESVLIKKVETEGVKEYDNNSCSGSVWSRK